MEELHFLWIRGSISALDVVYSEFCQASCDSELVLEKAQASRGALVLQPNEPDLYGYIAEWRDALSAFEQGKDALLNFEYGRLITMLVMVAYMSHEKKKLIDLTDSAVLEELEGYVPLIQQGRGAEALLGV